MQIALKTTDSGTILVSNPQVDKGAAIECDCVKAAIREISNMLTAWEAELPGQVYFLPAPAQDEQPPDDMESA